MAYNINDIFVGRSLDCHGEYCRGETTLFAQIVLPGAVALDVGANIGALTLPLARIMASGGTVVAMEPQRAAFQLLCPNLALNEIGNVRAIHAAADPTTGPSRIRAASCGLAFSRFSEI